MVEWDGEKPSPKLGYVACMLSSFILFVNLLLSFLSTIGESVRCLRVLRPERIQKACCDFMQPFGEFKFDENSCHSKSRVHVKFRSFNSNSSHNVAAVLH